MEQRHADAIVDKLEEMILTGAFADHDRLDEATLAQRFAVSRTPVREALQKLGHAGLVEAIPRRGVFVRQPGPVDLVQMFELMAELEAACGRLAAGRLTDPALDALTAANAGCHRALEAGDVDGYYHDNARFHHALYRAAGNAYLEQAATRLHKRLRAHRRMQLQLRGRMRQSMDEHAAVLAALRAGDGEDAARELRAHVAVQGEKFHRLLAGLQASGA